MLCSIQGLCGSEEVRRGRAVMRIILTEGPGKAAQRLDYTHKPTGIARGLGMGLPADTHDAHRIMACTHEAKEKRLPAQPAASWLAPA
jgi:hypothetical protein